tara:strand:+ start:373 stop:528 length:156 start_codon:yes stop_codon:yes gene_type:complete
MVTKLPSVEPSSSAALVFGSMAKALASCPVSESSTSSTSVWYLMRRHQMQA